MPAATTTSHPPDPSTLSGPVDIYVLRQSDNSSILDCVFVSRRSRRAAYATITHGTKTALWRVAADGLMTEVAIIDWECDVHTPVAGDGMLRSSTTTTKQKQAMVTHGGKMLKAEDFLRKGRGWFSSDSHIFTAEGKEYKWKSGVENPGPKDAAAHQRNPNAMYHDIWKMWRCVTSQTSPASARGAANATAVHSSAQPPQSVVFPRTPSPIPSLRPSRSMESLVEVVDEDNSIRAIITPMLSAPAPPTMLARFAPPQLGLTYNEIALFPTAYSVTDPGRPMAVVETMLVTAVILASKKGDYKKFQSAVDPAAMQATFVAEAAGEVPPYTPGGLGRGTRPRSRTHSGAVFRPPNMRSEEALAHAVMDDSADTTPLIRQPSARARNLFHMFTPAQQVPATNPTNVTSQTRMISGMHELTRAASVDSTRPSDGFYMNRRSTRQPSQTAATPAPAPAPAATVTSTEDEKSLDPPPAYA